MVYFREILGCLVPYLAFVILGLMFLRFRVNEERIYRLEVDKNERDFVRNLKELRKIREENELVIDVKVLKE